MLFSYLAHRKACQTKQTERQQRIDELGPAFQKPLSSIEQSIINQSVRQTVSGVQSGELDPNVVLTAYGKKALEAHAATNCLTEVMISAAQGWAKDCNRKGPLAGMPVSLKDTVGVEGWDGCIGYSAWVGKPALKDSAIIRLLRDAGAVPFVKTNIPITLLSFESFSDVFGRTLNPHKHTHSPGGSTGGEAALLAYGGSRIGIGTDVAGSVRVPAHYSGVYSIRCSVGRFLKMGSSTSMPGQEGVAPVYSPMARTLEDLGVFWDAIMSMRPWEYDHSCLAMPWNVNKIEYTRTPKWGVLWDDGIVRPSPACKRALQLVVDTLKKNGHEVVDINPPSTVEGFKIGSQLILADAGKTATGPIRTFESNDPGVVEAMRMFRIPNFLRKLYAIYIRYVKRDPLYADLIAGWEEKTIAEYWALVAQREAYKARWFEYMQEEKLDFVLTVPNALPAIRHGGMKDGWKSCGYSFLFNILDYSVGVLPVTHVHAALDMLPLSTPFKARNAIERDTYRWYDAGDMHGLPVGVQVVGKRLEEEKVFEGMSVIESLLKKDGMAYSLLNM
ncbi:amidase signature domain-containing protein [Crucibulum laeve]|uniref:amidase n=1 Tax=Crucibulum laeve TaxID=68775 RepID=A0A5C3MBD4_9AGAR|nr:amidase signature domain-containing protein [Crucibulum laeve]